MTAYDSSFLNPYLRAEQFPPDLLAETPVTKQPLATIWRDIEVGIASNDEQLVQSARDEACGMSKDAAVSSLTRVKAAMIVANSGLLALRASTGTFERADIRASAQQMGNVLHGMRTQKFGMLYSGDFTGYQSEIAAHYLIARRGGRKLVPYLASAREEGSLAQKANHDMYTIYRRPEWSNKVPFQVKSKRRQAIDFVGVIRMKRIIEEAKLPEEFGRLTIHGLGGLIAEEVQQPFTANDMRLNALNALTKKICEMASEHRLLLRKRVRFNRLPFVMPTSQIKYKSSF